MKSTPSASSMSWMDADVRILERRRGPGFLHEAAASLGLGDPLGREDLERDLAIEALVSRAVDDLELAAAELLEHRVVRECLPDSVHGSTVASAEPTPP